jgi:hypothetical protein
VRDGSGIVVAMSRAFWERRRCAWSMLTSVSCDASRKVRTPSRSCATWSARHHAVLRERYRDDRDAVVVRRDA